MIEEYEDYDEQEMIEQEEKEEQEHYEKYKNEYEEIEKILVTIGENDRDQYFLYEYINGLRLHYRDIVESKSMLLMQEWLIHHNKNHEEE